MLTDVISLIHVSISTETGSSLAKTKICTISLEMGFSNEAVNATHGLARMFIKEIYQQSRDGKSKEELTWFSKQVFGKSSFSHSAHSI